MENLVIKNDQYVIYASDSLHESLQPMVQELNKKIPEYNELFDVESFRQVEVHLFDNIEEFRNYIYGIRGRKDTLPEYATATFDNGMIVAFISPDNIRKTMLTHELFHIMYEELIWEKLNKPRYVWYDEGMAKMLCGEYHENDEDFFKNFFIETSNQTQSFPEDINGINHGQEFVNENYNGYKLGYICAYYLREVLSVEEFKELLKNPDKVQEIGQTVLKDAFDYYNKKYKLVEEEKDLRHAL